ncbi:Fc.00g102800.m01.CDS01 [Cosmosporella sp. VM-42]
MLRIAVAGGGGLGQLIVEELINAENAYNVVVLSRYNRTYTNPEIQVLAVDYSDQEALRYALQGMDLVISTVTGNEQIALINAAGHNRVRRFVPSEFEGALDKRPSNDPLGHGSSEARSLLRRWRESTGMKSTVFSCGIFMERFHPYGLGSLGVGSSSGVVNPGDYILNINDHTAQFVERDSDGHTVRVCMTSINDVARFVVAAIDLDPRNWRREYTMRGDRLSLRDVVGTCSRMLGVPFEHQRYQTEEIPAFISYYAQLGVSDSAAYYQRLLATANGRYDFSGHNLNDAIADIVKPVSFSEWLTSVYAP